MLSRLRGRLPRQQHKHQKKGISKTGVNGQGLAGMGCLYHHDEGGETLAQVAQRGGRCPIPGTIPGQVGRGSEHPDLVGDVPAHGRGLDWVTLKGPFPVSDSMNGEDRGW